MSALGVCPACESGNGHSFSCPVLLSREESDFESDFRNAFDNDAEDFDSDEFDFDSYHDSDSDWTDEDEAGLEEWEERRRERIAESNEY